MVRTLTILVAVLSLAALTVAAPSEDRVHLPIANYSVHNWYSGTIWLR
jgi:hypothetical protein